MLPDPKTLQALRDRGIEVEVLSTPEAFRRFADARWAVYNSKCCACDVAALPY